MPTLGWGQALLTLAVVLSVVALVLGAVWYRHRAAAGGDAAPFSFNFSMPSLPSFARRGRTHGSGVVGGAAAGGGGDERSERLLGANDDSAGQSALRNRPGGHSLI